MLVSFTSISLEYFSFTLLKDLVKVSLLSLTTAVTVIVRYAPTEPNLKKAKDALITALDSAVAEVPSKKDLFVLTDGKGRTSKSANCGASKNNMESGAYRRDVLHNNCKILMAFTGDNDPALV